MRMRRLMLSRETDENANGDVGRDLVPRVDEDTIYRRREGVEASRSTLIREQRLPSRAVGRVERQRVRGQRKVEGQSPRIRLQDALQARV